MAMSGQIEVTIRGGLDDGGEIVSAVVIGGEHEQEQQFSREANESLPKFQARVRAAAAGRRGISWGGLPDKSYEK
jgi:hypothetical protein